LLLEDTTLGFLVVDIVPRHDLVPLSFFLGWLILHRRAPLLIGDGRETSSMVSPRKEEKPASMLWS
jgi:hypothetical protein